MDARDVALQAVAPTVMVPMYSPMEALTRPGHRFLAAANGEWLEVRRAWLYARAQINRPSVVSKPYGDLSDVFEWTMPALPSSLIHEFIELAEKALPNEAAGWITWDEHTGQFRFRPVGVLSASRSAIHFDRPRLEDGEHLVVDIHSHGEGRAFFSSIDNIDDKGEVKISLVIGGVGTEEANAVCRLCLLGKFIPMAMKATSGNALTFVVSAIG